MDHKSDTSVEADLIRERSSSFPDTFQTMSVATCTEKPLLGQVTAGEELDPFDENVVEEEDHVHYKTLSWWQCGILMIAECISLGILSLPHAMATLGLLPGFMLIVGLGLVAGYTGWIIGQFKLQYPSCTSMADAGMILFGPVGRELFGLGQLIVLIFIMAAHITSFAIMMNVLTDHCTCTIILSIMGLLITILCTIPRTLKSISYFSIGSCMSVFTAVFIVMVAVGIAKPNPNQMTVIGNTDLVKSMATTLNIVLAYSGHVTYFGFASELRNPKDFTKSLIMMQSIAITVYTTCAFVIYLYVGPNVPAPALSAASRKVRVAAYAIASVTIVVAGVVNGSVGAKQIYLRVWQWKKKPQVVQQKSTRAYVSWISIVAGIWFLAWIIAEAIPKFEYVLALVAALLSGWYSFGITSFLWLWMNKGRHFSSGQKTFLTAVNIAILSMGCVISFLGLYACATAINDGQSGKPFSCANNDPLANDDY